MAQQPAVATASTESTVTGVSSISAPITRFAGSFKAYGIGLGVIFAAIPLITKGTELLPSYASVKNTLAFFTTLVSLLAVALLFGLRRRIGAHIFPEERFLSPREVRIRRILMIILPAVFIVLALGSVVGYLASMAGSVERAALIYAVDDRGQTLEQMLERDAAGAPVEAFLFGSREPGARVLGKKYTIMVDGEDVPKYQIHFQSEDGISTALERTPSFEIPGLWWIQTFYVLMFICGAVTFVWFGIIEYIQQELKLHDADLLRHPYCEAKSCRFRIAEVHDLDEKPAAVHFQFAYNPESFTMVGDPEGPCCTLHDCRLRWIGGAEDEENQLWVCAYRDNNQWKVRHEVTLAQDRVEIEQIIAPRAKNALEALKPDRAHEPKPEERPIPDH